MALFSKKCDTAHLIYVTKERGTFFLFSLAPQYWLAAQSDPTRSQTAVDNPSDQRVLMQYEAFFLKVSSRSAISYKSSALLCFCQPLKVTSYHALLQTKRQERAPCKADISLSNKNHKSKHL